MEQIVIRKRNGSLYRLFNYNKVSGVTSAEQQWSLSGEDVLNLSVVSAETIDFSIGDTIDVFGRLYTLNVVPNANKVNDRRFEYSVQFEGVQYQLIKVQYLDIDDLGYSSGSVFSLMGNVETFVTLIISNLERVYGAGTWQLGDFPADTEFQNIEFSRETCLQVVQKICDTYETNFDIERLPGNQFKLHIRKPATVLDDVFLYGRGRGLYGLQRMKANDKNIITRLYAYGGEKNIPIDYRNGSTRLKMPESSIFSEGQPYIDDATAIEKYGVIEGSVVYDEIYPNRTAEVTGTGISELQFYDTTMNFNLFEIINGTSTYLLPGVPAKIVFKTGNLAGYEFILDSTNGYNHTQRKFTLVPYTDSNGYVLPNPNDQAFQIAVGDKYTIVDVAMPQSYINEAEETLEITAGQYLYDNSRPRVQYGLTIDANYIEAKETVPGNIINYFSVGDFVKVKDNNLDIDGTAQIQSLKRNLLRHYEYDLTLGNEEVNAQRRIYRLQRKKAVPITRNASSFLSAAAIAQVTVIANTAGAAASNSSGIYTLGW